MEAQDGRDLRTQSRFSVTGRIDLLFLRRFCFICGEETCTCCCVFFWRFFTMASRLSTPAFLPPRGRASARDTDRLGSPYSVSRHLGTGSRATGLECRLQVARPRPLADGRSVPADLDSRP